MKLCCWQERPWPLLHCKYWGILPYKDINAGNRSKRVHQLDNYAGGHFLTADTRYQYSDNFYPGLMHLIGPWYRKSFRWLERGLISAVDTLSLGTQGLYGAAHPSFYLLAVVVLVLSWVVL